MLKQLWPISGRPTASASFIWVMLATACLSGCVVGPDYCRYEPCVPDLWHQELRSGVFVGQNELETWWSTLNDPVLDDLVVRARDNNLDLYAAATRIWQSRLQRAIVASERLPLVNGSSSFTHFLQSQNLFGNFMPAPGAPPIPEGLFSGARDQWSLGFDTAWELDFFGRIRRTIEAADANWQVSIEAYRDVMVCLYADVASNYVRVRSLQSQLQYARQNVESQRESLEIAEEAVDAGLAPILDVHQAATNLANTESQIPPLETSLNLALHRLAVLLGEYPGAVHAQLSGTGKVPSPQGELPLYLPVNLVRQRPDIRQAERQLAARMAEVGVAIGDLYPRFSLTGTFGLQSQTLSTLFEGDSWSHTVGPSVSWPIFQWWRLRNNVELSRSVVEETLVAYEQQVLLAVEEVENAIVAYNKELDRYQALQRATNAAQLSVEAVLALYREGETNFLNVLETQRALFNVQNQLAASEGDVVLQLIALYKALGGGWDPRRHCNQAPVRISCPQPLELVDVAAEYGDDPITAHHGSVEIWPTQDAPDGKSQYHSIFE